MTAPTSSTPPPTDNSVNDLRMQIKLNSQRAKTQDLAAGTEHLQIISSFYFSL